MRTVLYNARIIPGPGFDGAIQHGYVIVEGENIVRIGEGDPDGESEETRINLRGRIVLPGFINTHNHTPMILLRGIGDDLPLQEWLEKKMWPLEAKYTSEIAYWGSLLAQVEMIKSGTTTFADMYDNMDRVAEGVVESGLRAVLSRGIIGLCSREEQKRKLAEGVRFADEWNQTANGRIRTMISPHSAYTCPEGFLREIVEKAREMNLPIHTHLSETKKEVEDLKKQTGKGTVYYLDELGLFDGPSLVAHAVHLEDGEISLLAEKNVKISHNLISNLKLGSGIMPLKKMKNHRLTISLGTDSAASNNSLDLFEEMRGVALLHKGVEEDPTLVTAEEAFGMATMEGAKALFWEEEIGSLAPGKKADLIVVNINQSHFTPSRHFLSHLVYAARGGDVLHMMVNGRWLMWNREILTMDEERILYEAERAFDKLLAM
ncbi:amidohydrolase [Thermicanus aegyptius]|uniref:amidohydrolase n=1 Tax=Thermicanus aegyptius TaxID=94009 RepID=UPI0006950412